MLESLVGAAFGAGMRAVARAAESPSHLEVGEASIDVSFDSDHSISTRQPCSTG